MCGFRSNFTWFAHNWPHQTNSHCPLLPDFAAQSSELTGELNAPPNQHITQNQCEPIQPLYFQQPVHQVLTQQSSVQVQPAMSKNNEPVKLVYPSKIPNGTINLATIPSQQQQPNIIHTSTSMAANSGTNTVTGQQPQTILIKNQVRFDGNHVVYPIY